MNKKLITGGCGFLGSNLAQDAVESGDEVYILDNLQRAGSRINLEWLQSKYDINFIHGDVRDHQQVETAIRAIQPDFVYHLAGQVAMTTSIANPFLDLQINVNGTVNILEAIRKYSNETALIYSSTNKVYGDLEQFKYTEGKTRYHCVEHPLGFDENTQICFHSPYGCSKGAADQYVLDYARIYGLRTTVFRHSSMYGGRQYATFDQGWVGWFCEQALSQKRSPIANKFTIAGNGKQVRDLLHATDMKNLYKVASHEIDNISGQAFNIGGGYDNSMSLLELFATLEDILNIKLQYEKTNVRKSDQKIFIADTKKINDAIGWAPTVSSKTGVSLMLDWLEQQYRSI